jgi:ubiquinol-cytochrome c reductase cytochrome b subunit
MAITGYFSKPGASMAATKATTLVEPQAIPLSTAGPSSEISESAKRGVQLINSLGCIGCHRVEGKGGTVGPELSPDVLRGKSSQWLIIQIRNPKAHFPTSIMPSFSSLSDRQINDVVDFLLTLAQGRQVPPGPAVAAPTPAPSPVPPSGPAHVKVLGPQAPPGPASYIIGNVDLGEYLFKQNCEQCHGIQGKDKVPNPGSTDGTVPPLNPIDPTLFDNNAQTFVNKIDSYIQHGSIPAGPNPVLHMLPFGDSKSLTQQMIANVEAYVLHLNGANRAQLVHPGMKPHLFFWLVVIIFGCVLGGFCIWKGRAR